MKRTQLVLLRLKPKVKQLGFNVKELKGIAAKIADNLESEDDASDEDVNAEIDAKIDAVLPFLSFGQSQANRLLDEWKKNHPKDDDDNDEEDDPASEGRQGSVGKASGDNGKKNDDDVPDWVKGLQKTVETLTGEIATLKGEKVTGTRRAKLETLLKDTGTFGKRTLKSFEKMKFDNEEEFEDFLSEVKEDLKDLNQERADAGLSTMGAPPVTGKGSVTKEEPFSDEEIDALADY